MMSTQQSNPAFVPDDDIFQKNLSAMQNAGDSKAPTKDVYTLDMKTLNSNEEKNTHHDEYDPFMHRDVEHPTTDAETMFHLLKGSLGTGILAMPNAFYHAGYMLGLIGTLLIGIICTYCIHVLIKAEYVLCKRRKQPSLTYPATAEAAFSDGPPAFQKFAPYSGHMVNFFLFIYQLGTCSVYMVFIASNVKSVADYYVTEIALHFYLLMFLLPLILINWIRNLKFLAPFSTAANVITFVSFGIIVYYLFHDGPTFEEREPVGKVEHWPLFFGTVLFALEAIGVIMPLENEMKTPKSFGGNCGVLNISLGTIIVLYIGMGFLGYLTYGAESQGTITLNIPDHDVLAQVVKVMLALAIYISYSLQCYVAVDIAWNGYLLSKLEKNNRKTILEYILRTVLVIITFLMAVIVPKLDLFISLFGALCLSALGIAIPALIDISTYWYERTGTIFWVLLGKDILLIIFGILGLIVGTWISLQNIIKEFME